MRISRSSFAPDQRERLDVSRVRRTLIAIVVASSCATSCGERTDRPTPTRGDQSEVVVDTAERVDTDDSIGSVEAPTRPPTADFAGWEYWESAPNDPLKKLRRYDPSFRELAKVVALGSDAFARSYVNPRNEGLLREFPGAEGADTLPLWHTLEAIARAQFVTYRLFLREWRSVLRASDSDTEEARIGALTESYDRVWEEIERAHWEAWHALIPQPGRHSSKFTRLVKRIADFPR